MGGKMAILKMFLKSFILFAGLALALRCPGGKRCTEEESCCKLPGGTYSCCPSQKEVMNALPMIPTGMVNDITVNSCPDNGYCPAEYSCIQLPLGSFGCCPLAEAVRCEDGNHCCPKGFHCSKDGKSCIKESDVPNLDAVICPDGRSECPEFSTCCEMPDRSWGCCPYSQAVCCEDMEHCCPERTRCDLVHYRCVSHTGSLRMKRLLPSGKVSLQDGKGNPKLDDVPCPNKTNGCPDGTTCCQLRDGHYGCCPFENAVCCKDHEHCCPQGYSCDLVKMKCELLNSQMRVKIAAVTSKARDVICDDTAICPNGNTCCKMESGEWGCCPLPKAVCCEDHKSCCPEGTTCNLSSQTCDSPKGSVPLLAKTAALRKNTRDVICDDTAICPDGNTCCKMESGEWGCCPLPNAVCCEDHKSCCPEGTTCNLSSQTCDSPKGSMPLLAKTAALRKNTQDVICDETASCPDGNTCCKMESGQWGCCPLPKAVCCEDHESCCPEGTTCNLSSQTCDSSKGSTTLLAKTAALRKNARDVICDDAASCPDGTTCCKMESGEWGCCPLPKAVCCEDHESCCPEGTTCNLSSQTCDSHKGSTPLLAKTAALRKNARDVVCDETASCPDYTTCCKMLSGKWGCCPLPNAVCCEDHKSCCPEGTKCNLSSQTCDSPKGSTPLLAKTAALRKNTQVVKCDETASCPDDTTCCKLVSGVWGCCPFPKAVCCEDGKSCCPEGMKCNLSYQTCESSKGNLPLLAKTAAVRKNTRDVVCDETTSCPDGSTCCKMMFGKWGCCPLPNAVCCEDHKSCCPEGTKCNLSSQTCDSPKGSTPLLSRTAALRKNTQDVICDETASCPDGSTCCKMESGEWGCCPLPNAVCCEDHKSCCPEGTKCNLSSQTCDSPIGSIPLLAKTAALRKNTQDVVCDEITSCPDGETCCKMASGHWGCCPIPEAVCCEDHVHCCPQGSKCNLRAQTCDHSKGSIPLLTKTAALRKNTQDVFCNKTSSCPDGSTCCKLTSGAWGCCPMSKAVCCEDHEHCCPEGTQCNLAAQTCDSRKGRSPLLTKTAAAIRKTQDVVCDETTSCPDGATCCKMASGKWGCCPLPKAVCCKDGEHCCPEGTKCNLPAETCDSPQGRTPLFSKSSALSKIRDVCDETASCPPDSTCCKMESGEWGCCPFPKAVCCEDHMHCCPSNYKCNVSAGTCDQLSQVVSTKVQKSSLYFIFSKTKTSGKNVKCDSQHSCPSNQTCCRTTTGSWGCCQFEEAVCCEDKLHCCPKGYSCSTTAGTCVKRFRWDVPFSNSRKAFSIL